MNTTSIVAALAACSLLLPIQTGPGTRPGAFALMQQGKYLVALVAAEKEAESGPLALDTLAIAQASSGDCQGALETFARLNPSEPTKVPASSPLDKLMPVEALEAIVAEAKNRRVVIVNEAHHVPRHRAFIQRVVVALAKEGFTYYAAETFSPATERITARGYPALVDGFYSVDPVFGDVIRRALRLGYRPVAYETTSTSGTGDDLDRINARETDQCQHLVDRIFSKDAAAKVLIHVGYSHATEDWRKLPDGREIGWLAARLQRATGLDPLTIDQTAMMEGAREELGPPLWRYANKQGWLTRSVAFRRADGTYFTGGDFAGKVDIQVFHPAVTVVEGRPSWLAMDGYREAVDIPTEWQPKGGRVLVQAFVTQEGEDAVPMDQIVLRSGEPVPVLMLPAGDYRLILRDEQGQELAREVLTV